MKPVITKHQISMTEWFAAIGQAEESNTFRAEDNRKTERLEMLYQIMNVPYERPDRLPARELADEGPRFREILDSRGNDLCAIRLVPKKPELPKLRQRGLTINDCYNNWYKQLDINPDDYDAFICPHSETLLWSATLVINEQGVYGEIVRGLHSQLTHGYTENQLYQFTWDFQNWTWSPAEDDQAAEQIQSILGLLKSDDSSVQFKLDQELQSKFANGYLMGYFESTVWPDGKAYIIDYNRLLPKYLPKTINLQSTEVTNNILQGVSASQGSVSGKVRIVSDPSDTELTADDILVCDMTDVRYLPHMKNAAAIITDRGGILSHAAIISRELGKPCIIGTKNATTVLHDGDEVEVDADHGTVKILHRAS